MLLNCGIGQDSWESLGQQDIQPVYPKVNQSWIFIWKDWCWSWNSNTLDTRCEELTHWKRPWCWERLKAGGGGGDGKRWDGWMFKQALEIGKGQGSLVCCNPKLTKSWPQLSDWTELNWTELVVKNLPMQETQEMWVQPLGQKDPLQ